MNRLRKYLLTTFFITWALWIGDALLVRFADFQESDFLPMVLFTAGGFGPTIAAICCMEQKKSLKNILRFIFCNKKFSVLALLAFVAMASLTFGLSSMELNTAIPLTAIPLVLLEAITLYGGNEELGWRGVMQPVLQAELPYPVATLIVGVVWSIWHAPLWFIEGNSHQGSSFVIFSVLAILLTFWLSAIINSGGSVFWCMILHGVCNTLLSVFVIKVNSILILGLLLMTAISILISIRSMSRIRTTDCIR